MDVAILLALIALNALFAMAEIALITAKRAKLQRMVDGGDRRAAAALELSERVAPRHVPRIGRTDTVDQSLDKLIMVNGKLMQRCHRFGDSRLSRFGNASLVIIRQLRADAVHDGSIVGVSQFADSYGHYRAFRVKLNISSKSLIGGDSTSSVS